MKKKKRAARVVGSENDDPILKAIGTSDSDSAGKKNPAQFADSFGLLDEGEKGPAMFQSQGKADIPTDGLVLAPNWMAESVVTGKKTMIVKTKPFEIEGKIFLIIHNSLAYGVAELGKMEEMDDQRFRDTEMEHLIAPDLRDLWCSQQEGWCSAPYYAWPIKRAMAFEEPKEINVPTDALAIVRNVVFKRIQPDPQKLFMCARLPAALTKKYSEMSQAIAQSAGVDPEVVDHATLLFVPSAFDLPKESVDIARQVAEDVVAGTGAITVKIQGWAYFDGAKKDGEEKTALVALLDAPGLAEVHIALKTALTAIGFAADQQIHGFVPHTTLAYLPHGARIDKLPVLTDEFTIDKVEFVNSDIRELTLKSEDDLRKASDTAPDADPENATTGELKKAHDDLHKIYRPQEGSGESDFSTKDIVNLHAQVVDELRARDIEHPPPPDDGLDGSSEKFETKVQKEIIPPDKIEGSIHISDVLPHFKTFRLQRSYVYLVGKLASDGSTEGDIDILVKGSQAMSEEFKNTLLFKLGQVLPGDLAKRLSIHYEEFHESYSNHVELFDLVLERVNQKNEVKIMRLEGQYPVTEPTELELMDEREKTYAELSAENWEDDDVPTE